MKLSFGILKKMIREIYKENKKYLIAVPSPERIETIKILQENQIEIVEDPKEGEE